jgi:hypothetical protein
VNVNTDNTTWTCFCGERQPDTDDMPDRCPNCGGVWCREIHLTSWQRMKDRIRRRFERSVTFESADDLIAWLEDGALPSREQEAPDV